MGKRKNNLYHLPVKKKQKKKSSLASTTSLSNQSNLHVLKNEFIDITVQSLLNALRCKDDYTWGHSLRVAYFCISVGKELGLNEAELYDLEISALFHDIGKIGVPDAVLLKPSRLSDEEFVEMKLHPTKSYQILKDFPIFHQMALNAKHHHERFDGRGYPDGLKGNDIPLFARIILIADTFDAMTSTRPYRKGLPFDVAFAELREFAGTQFDPIVVESFISAMTKEQAKPEEHFNLNLIQGDFKKDAA